MHFGTYDEQEIFRIRKCLNINEKSRQTNPSPSGIIHVGINSQSGRRAELSLRQWTTTSRDRAATSRDDYTSPERWALPVRDRRAGEFRGRRQVRGQSVSPSGV